jgi:predicted esterase
MDRSESVMNLRDGLMSGFRWIVVAVGLLLVLQIAPCDSARADTINLQDGRMIEGRLSKLNSMILNPGVAPPNANGATPIVMVDNDLCRVYVPFKFVKNADPAPAGQRLEEIDVQQSVATTGQQIGSVGSILQVKPFDEHGVRTFSMSGARGPIDVVQGITRLTPIWARVEGLQLSKSTSYVWEMRLATNSIPQKLLAAIIANQINAKKFEDRVKVVRFYLQMERYDESKAELDQLIRDFPGREGLDEVVHNLQQFRAKQRFGEIEIRGKAGQHQLALKWLQSFPADGVDGDMLQQVRSKLDEYTEIDQKGNDTLMQLNELMGKLPDSGLRERVRPVVNEIANEMSSNTLGRMATYQRFAGGHQTPPENKLALAISGWLLGAGDAIEDLPRALSMVELRNLVRQYLQETDQVRRDACLKKIQASEAVTPKFIAGLAAHMKPPLEPEPQPTPGFYEFSIPASNGDPAVTYFVQLPPEYDPHSSYPCVVTLHGAGSTPKQQIDWWAGEQVWIKDTVVRVGQAARYGYIVIAPEWTMPHQGQYEGTAREHDAVLSSLRLACRRFAIDTDRVFLSGHSMGGDAAWDMGLAHPDLWAGVIPIVASATKTVQQYRKNAELVPLYFVCGELDGNKMVTNGSEFDAYMQVSRAGVNDCTVVEYEGRGHEHFSDDILHIFDWMGRKQRNFFPRRFDVATQRPFDNFFWWLEMRNFQPAPGRNFTPGSNLTGSNGVAVRGVGGKPTVWLAPEMVDFSKPVNVALNGKSMAPPKNIQPDIATLLEDIRTRGDRQHPFWAKVE